MPRASCEPVLASLSCLTNAHQLRPTYRQKPHEWNWVSMPWQNKGVEMEWKRTGGRRAVVWIVWQVTPGNIWCKVTCFLLSFLDKLGGVELVCRVLRKYSRVFSHKKECVAFIRLNDLHLCISRAVILTICIKYINIENALYKKFRSQEQEYSSTLKCIRQNKCKMLHRWQKYL